MVSLGDKLDCGISWFSVSQVSKGNHLYLAAKKTDNDFKIHVKIRGITMINVRYIYNFEPKTGLERRGALGIPAKEQYQPT